MRPLKEKVSITLDTDLVEKLRRYSEKDDRSLSAYINVVLKRHIENLEQKNHN